MEIIEKEKFINDVRKNIGIKIKDIREKKGLSQDDLASLLKVNHSTISKIENGKFSLTIDYLAKFAWALRFEIELAPKN
jgi:transcriptional regulator with XRE-family HTH domain